MEQRLKKVLKYFSFFAYDPTLDEIHTFFPIKISKEKLEKLIKAKKYTPPQYSISPPVIPRSEATRNLAKRNIISKNKLNSLKFKIYIKFLSIFPQIKLVGLSGSIAMMNADLDDDIDLFIISSKNRLFTARFLATFFAYIMGLKRGIGLEKAPNKVCLNLFFDESKLTVPKIKKTEFVAHEILQMKPIISKGNVYQQFLKANRWVFKLFPNAVPSVIPSERSESRDLSKIRFLHFGRNDKVSNYFEKLLKNLQLKLINKHRTTEIITASQLWFHPVDFGKKIMIG